MELVKTNEVVSRTFTDGEPKEVVTAVTYAVVENGLAIGQADIQDGRFWMNVSMEGSIDELRNRVENMFASVQP